MARLIDADDFIKKLAVAPLIQEAMRKAFTHMPTVDVVWCKDCRHYWKNNPSDDVPVCLASPKDDAFCSEGERREDETD